MSHWKESISLDCHNLNVECSEDSLHIQLDGDTGEFWENRFDEKDIEEMTRKTGNFKQFNIFSRMLHDSICNETRTLSLHVMTLTNLLEMVGKTNHDVKESPDRYAILTYRVKYDKIYYPMKLIRTMEQKDVHQNQYRSLKIQFDQLNKQVQIQQQQIQKLISKLTEMEESNKQLRMEVRSRSRNRVSPVRFRSASLNKYKSKYRNYIRDSSDDSTDYGTYRNGNLSRNKHRTNLTRNRRMRSSNESLSSTQSFNMKQRLLPSNRSNSNESIKLLERRKNYSNSIRDRNRNILLKKKKKKCKSINMEDSVTFTSLNEKINDLQNFLCNV